MLSFGTSGANQDHAEIWSWFGIQNEYRYVKPYFFAVRVFVFLNINFQKWRCDGPHITEAFVPSYFCAF